MVIKIEVENSFAYQSNATQNGQDIIESHRGYRELRGIF